MKSSSHNPTIKPGFTSSTIKSGVTSVSLDAKTLKAAAGLEIAGTKNTVTQKGLTHQNLTGADVGDVAIDAISKPVFNNGCSIFG
jgi:hypothetical protein